MKDQVLQEIIMIMWIDYEYKYNKNVIIKSIDI
jgi:hypothetical protein